jgi:C-terminal processing protease CtpA/Prc
MRVLTALRIGAMLAAALFLVASLPAPTAADPPVISRTEALLALCRVWNAVRFMHPSLASETDGRWDDALLAAEPIVAADPSKLSDAAASMLATLHDPLTIVGDDRKAGPSGLPSAEDRAGVRVVHVEGYPAAANADAYAKALSGALTVPSMDRALLVDLRTGAPPSFEQLDELIGQWKKTSFVTHLVQGTIRVPPTARRYYLGFPSEDAALSENGYQEGRETTEPVRTIAAADDARAVPVAFVTDASSFVPIEALALERAGLATIFSSDGSTGILPGDVEEIDAGAGLRVAMRTAAVLDPPGTRGGSVDEALAWLATQRGASSPAAKPVYASPSPAATDLPIGQRYAATTLPDERHRVLAAFRMWGAIAYLFPYRNLMHDDWDAALRSDLADEQHATTSLEYELALSRMYAHIHDSHGYIYAPAVATAYAGTPRLLAREVEGRPTIVRVDPVAARRDGFAVGDVIEAVDGESVVARTARLRPYLPVSSEQSFRELFLTGTGRVALLAGPLGSSVTLRVRSSNGRLHDVRTRREAVLQRLRTATRPVVDLLPGDIGYADLSRLTVPQVAGALSRFSRARAIVFDLRGYPHGTAWPLARRFLGAQTRVALFRTPVRRVPLNMAYDGTELLGETRDFYQVVTPDAPRLRQPVVVVIDARAISQSEHTGLFLSEAAHARFVGEPTTGANGDVTRFLLPGGISANFTGQAVLHANGAQLQRIGLIPDVRVEQTLRGVLAGDDELLAAGLREALRMAGTGAAATRSALAAERVVERADARGQLRLPSPPPVTANALPVARRLRRGRRRIRWRARRSRAAQGRPNDRTARRGGCDVTVRHVVREDSVGRLSR